MAHKFQINDNAVMLDLSDKGALLLQVRKLLGD